MKILVATDSFKDALPALEVCKAIQRGIHQVSDKIDVELFPLGDGGEGTAEVLTWHSHGDWKKVTVLDPLFRPVQAYYGLSKDRRVAFIEMAQASGLQLLIRTERNALRTSTYGTGQLMAKAIQQGAKRIVLGIGGSATNDVGIGMAGALGVKFKKRNDHQHKGSNWLKRAELVGEQLENIQTIDASEMIKLSDVEVQVLCDVDNPLTGATGATHTYARQKGADDAAIKKLENGVLHFGSLLEAHYGKAIISVPGAGAAGGLGAGAMAFLNARLQSGINYVLDNTNFESALKSADLVITGEGKIDQQTLYGKLIKGITERANKLEIPVIALCGSLLLGPEQIKLSGLKSAHSINPEGIDLETALLSTASHLEQTTTRVINAAIS